MAGTKVFYSGVESEAHYSIAKKYAHRTLTSFFYVRKNKAVVKRRFEEDGLQWMIDSGAHTLQKETGQEYTSQQWDDYIKEYAEWLNDNKMFLYSAVELDVGSQIGLPVIYAWREKHCRPLEEAGMQIIYVWHDEQTPIEWVEMCRKYRYVGLTHQSLVSNTTQQRMLNARRYRTKVHGFALTSGRALRDFALATADSTSWKSGERFGSWMAFDDDHLRTIEKKDRGKWEEHIDKAGFNFSLMCKEDRNEVTSFCIHEFRKMEEALCARKKGIDYWTIRAPYPKVVLGLRKEIVDDWMKFLNLESGSFSNRDGLYAVSLLQNSKASEYLASADKYNSVLSELMDILVQITDQTSFNYVLDDFNNRFKLREEIRKRTKDDYGNKDIIQERGENWEEELAEAKEDSGVEGGSDEI